MITTIAFCFLFLIILFLVYKGLKSDPMYFIIVLILCVYGIPFSFIVPEKVYTIYEKQKCSTELEDNILYIRIKNKLYSFDKMKDIETFKDKTEVVLKTERNMWKGNIDSLIVEDFPKEHK